MSRQPFLQTIGVLCITMYFDRANAPVYELNAGKKLIYEDESDKHIIKWAKLAEDINEQVVNWRLEGIRLVGNENGVSLDCGFKNRHFKMLMDSKCPGVGGPPSYAEGKVIENEQCGRIPSTTGEIYLKKYKEITARGFESHFAGETIALPFLWRLQNSTNRQDNYKGVQCIRLATSIMQGFKRSDVNMSQYIVLYFLEFMPWDGVDILHDYYNNINTACFDLQEARSTYIRRMVFRYGTDNHVNAFEFQTINGYNDKLTNGIGDMKRPRNTEPYREDDCSNRPYVKYFEPLVPGEYYYNLVYDICPGWVISEVGVYGCGKEVGNDSPCKSQGLTFRLVQVDSFGARTDERKSAGTDQIPTCGPLGGKHKNCWEVDPVVSSYSSEVMHWHSPPAVTIATQPSYQPHVVGFDGWVKRDFVMATFIPIWAYEQTEDHRL